MKSLRKMDKYDIKIIPLRWGNTPQNQVDGSTEFGKWMLERVIPQIEQKPDVFMQVSVANEFEPQGYYNIGVTAGVETTICPMDFIEGSNKMDLILVPSNFTKQVMVTTGYQQKNQQTGEIVSETRLTTPVEVLFEGVDTEIFSKGSGKDVLANVKEDFNFLIVGHWLKGDLGQDRKDIGMAIKTFATVFQYLPKDKRPGLIVKTSHAADMSNLYHNPKVKAMLSFAKGEGYGRPMAEFTLTGKPIIASGWSGHTDFLPPEHAVLLEGSLTNVHESAADQFLMKEAQWFTVQYSNAANKIYDVYNNYNIYSKKSEGLKSNTLANFTLDKMNEVFTKLMENTKAQPKVIGFNAPKLNKTKMQLPKLNKL